MENTPISESKIWTTVLRATTNTRDEHGISVQCHASWTLETAADESGLKITQVYFGDDLKDLAGNPVSWNYNWHYEIEHRKDGLCESIWWPVLHKPAPVLAPPIPNVLVLVEGGVVEVGMDMPVNLFIMDLDIKDDEREPTKQERGMFDLIWDRLPEHRGVDDNGSIYDFSAVGL